MPDTLPARAITGEIAESERRSLRPTGLPILSTEPLTAAERSALEQLRKTMGLVVARLDELLDNRAATVARGLEVTNLADRAGQCAGQLAAMLGRGR